MANGKNLDLRCLCGFIADTEKILSNHSTRHISAAVRNPHAPANIAKDRDYTSNAREKVIRTLTRNLSSRGLPQIEESVAKRDRGEVKNTLVREASRFEFLDPVSSSESDTELDSSLPGRNDELSLSDLGIFEVLSISGSSSSSISSISDDSRDCPIVLPPVNSDACSPIHPPSISPKPKKSRKRVRSIPSQSTNLMSKYLKLVAARVRNEMWTDTSDDDDDATGTSDSFSFRDSDSN